MPFPTENVGRQQRNYNPQSIQVNEKLRKVLQQFDLIVKDTDGENIHSFSGLLQALRHRNHPEASVVSFIHPLKHLSSGKRRNKLSIPLPLSTQNKTASLCNTPLSCKSIMCSLQKNVKNAGKYKKERRKKLPILLLPALVYKCLVFQMF